MTVMASRIASRPKIRSVPDLVHKEALAALLASAVIMIFSALSDAPIQGPPDPSAPASTSIKAPWIFVGIQFMLKFIHPLLAGILIPSLALLLFASVSFTQLSKELKGWLFFSALFTAVLFSLLGYLG